MAKAGFLAKLHQEGKLMLVEPNDNLKKAYFIRGEESLSSAKALQRIGNLKDAVALAYYAMYHTLLGFLFQVGIKCENHSAAIILLQKLFSIPNETLTRAKEERIDKQYYVDFNITQKDTKDAIQTAERFIAEIKDSSERKMNQDILAIRKGFEELVSP